MGRVSRHKKVKSHDPFYRGRRNNDLKGVNLRPVNEDEQAMPKTLIRLMKRSEALKKGGKRKKRKTFQHDPSATEKRTCITQDHPSKNLVSSKAEEHVVPAVREGPMFKRKKGESLKSYLERVDVEANARIVEALKKNKKMRPKRKEYLEDRRKKALLKRKGLNIEEVLEFNSLKDEVKFGEVVMAPPQLQAQPRGCKESQPRKPKILLLHQKFSECDPSPAVQTCVQVLPVVGLKRKWDLEVERERAIRLYRQEKKMKEKRKQS